MPEESVKLEQLIQLPQLPQLPEVRPDSCRALKIESKSVRLASHENKDNNNDLE